MAEYKCQVGLMYGKHVREPGEVVSDIPAQSIPWLLEQGAIVPVEGTVDGV